MKEAIVNTTMNCLEFTQQVQHNRPQIEYLPFNNNQTNDTIKNKG